MLGLVKFDVLIQIIIEENGTKGELEEATQPKFVIGSDLDSLDVEPEHALVGFCRKLIEGHHCGFTILEGCYHKVAEEGVLKTSLLVFGLFNHVRHGYDHALAIISRFKLRR